MSLFNPKSDRIAQREAQIQDRARMKLERQLRPKLLKEFVATSREAEKAYLNGNDSTMMAQVFLEHQNALKALLQPTYARTIESTAKYAIDQAPKSALAKVEKKDLQGSISSLLRTWMTTFALKRSKSIAEYSKELVVDTIYNGAEEGLGEAVIAKNIRTKLGGGLGRARARTIARTETHSASQSALLETVDNLQLPPMLKKWITIEDDRTRESHRNAHGQKRKKDEPFQVGDASLQFPSDPSSGEADEVINCRCAMVFESEF